MDESRQDPSIITAWETLALRCFDSQAKYNAVRMGADGGAWCLVGRTVLVRTEILQNNPFYNAFVNEMWFGKKLNTGDDVSVTRWIQHTAGWDVAIQETAEAVVTTTIKRDSGFAKQVIRWQRSTVMMLITHPFSEPGIVKLARTHTYMARKMVERLLRPALNYLYIYAWLSTVTTRPVLA
jgi:cellulose synthase/poly-beta-1,6-N-acetylglucosamine synthase-like glycosyltransferase